MVAPPGAPADRRRALRMAWNMHKIGGMDCPCPSLVMIVGPPLPGRTDPAREAFRRYAGRPRAIEEALISAYYADQAGREPVADDEAGGGRQALVSGSVSLLDQAIAVEELLPPRSMAAPATAGAGGRRR